MNKSDFFRSGLKIRALRTVKGQKLKDVAAHLDIDPAYLSVVESGRKSPSIKVLKSAAKYFDVDVSYFKYDDELADKIRKVIDKNSVDEILFAFESLLKDLEQIKK